MAAQPAHHRASRDPPRATHDRGRVPVGRDLKFVYANQGVGRFTKLGFPLPLFTASFVGGFEIVGGVLILAGLLTRVVAIPFVIEMIVATLSTKIALYLGTSPLPLPAAPPLVGFWAVMHETRSEYAQLLTALYLVIVGPGLWSLDARLRRARDRIARGRAPPTPEPPEAGARGS